MDELYKEGNEKSTLVGYDPIPQLCLDPFRDYRRMMIWV